MYGNFIFISQSWCRSKVTYVWLYNRDTTFEQLIFRLHHFIYSRNLRGTKKSRDRISKVSPVHFLRRQTQNCSLVNSKMWGTQNVSAHCFMLMGWGGVRERSLDIFRGGPWVIQCGQWEEKTYWWSFQQAVAPTPPSPEPLGFPLGRGLPVSTSCPAVTLLTSRTSGEENGESCTGFFVQLLGYVSLPSLLLPVSTMPVSSSGWLLGGRDIWSEASLTLALRENDHGAIGNKWILIRDCRRGGPGTFLSLSWSLILTIRTSSGWLLFFFYSPRSISKLWY